MGRMLILAVAIVFSVSSAYAQSEQQVQTGFAAVNPVVGSGVGLMVFGRVGHRDGDDLVQSTVWAASVVTNSALVVSSDVSAGENTGIAIVNPSNFTANITLTLRNQQGAIVASRTIVLNALHQISRFVTELLNVNGTGLLSINSTAPIALVGLQFKGASFSVVPTNGPPGETALLLPQFATGGGWSTDVVIANLTGIAQTVRIDFYNPEGVIIATLPNVNVPPAGVTVINR